MAFYFQPPIFEVRPQIFPTIITPTVLSTFASPQVFTVPPLPIFQYFTFPAVSPQYTPPNTSKIKISVVFHGTRRLGHRRAFFYVSTDVSYDMAPSLETLLADVSSRARQNELEDRVYAYQVTLYLTRRAACPLVASEDGTGLAPAVEDVVRTVALGERPLGREFEGLMEEIKGGRYGAFLMVDVDVDAGTTLRSQQDNESVGSEQRGDTATTAPTPSELEIQLELEPSEVTVSGDNGVADS